MLEAVISLGHVSHSYGSGPEAVPALRDVSLALIRGDMTLVMGPSGSGKTTLLSVMGCLLTPETGDVCLMGQPVSRLSEEIRSRLRRRHVGFVFQAFRLFRSLTALENVLVALDLSGGRGVEARRAALKTLETLGIANQASRRPHQLSGGQKQRVAIARALAAAGKVRDQGPDQRNCRQVLP